MKRSPKPNRRFRRPPADPAPTCTLCSAPLTGQALLGIWAPTAEWVRRLSSARVERRTIAYVLCVPCAARPDRPTAIEAALIERIGAELAAEAEAN